MTISTRYFLGAAGFAAGTSYYLLGVLGLTALPMVVALWAVSLPIALRHYSAELKRDAVGVFFVFGVAGNIDVVEFAAGGSDRRISTLLLALGVLYLLANANESRELLRSRLTLLLVAFFSGEVLNGAAFSVDDLGPLALSRAGQLVSVLVTVLLTRRRPWLMAITAVWALSMSVPLMIQEIVNQGQIVLSSTAFLGVARAGGFFAQADNAALALTYAAGFAIWLYLQHRVSGAVLATVVVAGIIGILCSASRGGLLAMLALLALFCGLAAPRFGKRLLVVAGVIALLAFLVPDTFDAAGDAISRQLVEVGVPATSISRYVQVFAALGGSTDQLMADNVESQRIPNAMGAIETGLDHPLFGIGSGRFIMPLTMERSHFQLAEIFANNGLVGLALYLVFLGTLLATLLRRTRGATLTALVPLLPWLMTHLQSHNIWDMRFHTVPVAFAWGLAIQPTTTEQTTTEQTNAPPALHS